MLSIAFQSIDINNLNRETRAVQFQGSFDAQGFVHHNSCSTGDVKSHAVSMHLVS